MPDKIDAVIQSLNEKVDRNTTHVAVLEAKVDDIITVRQTVLDIHGDVSVLKESSRELHHEMEGQRKKSHNHANHINNHAGKIQILEKNIDNIKLDQKATREDVSEIKDLQLISGQNLKVIKKLIVWGGLIVASLISADVDLKPLIKELMEIL